MNRVICYIQNENYKMDLTENSVDLDSVKHRTLYLSKDITIKATDKQLEDLFHLIDTKLHPLTYSDLQDKLLSWEEDLEKMNATLEMYQENVAMDVLNRG